MVKKALIAACCTCWLTGCTEPPPAPAPEAEQQRHTVTASWVTHHILPSDANITRSIKAGYLVPVGKLDLDNGLYDKFEQMAARMELPATPAIYIDITDVKPAPETEARFTREGRMYIVTNHSAYDKWTPRQYLAAMGHELVHLKERHVTAESIADAYNDPSLSIAHELEADEVGSGPLGSCDPQALKEALQIVTETDMKEYFDSHPERTNEDYNMLVGHDHPLWPERAARLDAMAANPLPECLAKKQ